MTDLRTRPPALQWPPFSTPASARALARGSGSRTARALGWTGLVVGLLTLAVTAAMALLPGGQPDLPVWLTAPVALGFATLGPGAALLCHTRSRDPVVTWALVVLLSLATFTAAAAAQVFAGWWNPSTVVLLLAGAVVAGSAAGLLRTRRTAAARVPATAQLATAPPTTGRPERRRRGTRALFGHLAVLAAGAALWQVAVAGTDPASVGEFGLLASVHPAFFGALLLTAGGFVTALRRPGARGLLLGAYLVLLALILHGTTPLLLDQVQYAWTYKHIGVVELFRDTGGLTDPRDLYQQWPALFAGVAGLADLSGLAPLTLAAWSPVFFNLAGGLVLLAIGRTLSADRRLAWLTVAVFFAVNWVEEDYLSPQALAFLLSLGVLLVTLRWLRRDGPPRTGRLGRLTARLTTGLPSVPAVSTRQRAAAIAALVALFAVLTITHQLSPYLVVGQVAVLALLALVRPVWTPVLLAVVAVGYLAPRLALVSGSFDLFESLNIFGNAAGNAEGGGSAGQTLSAAVVRTLAVTVWALAAYAVWRARHRIGTVVVPAVLAAAPFTLLVLQSYGGEAIYRVFLFSAPWCAYLIADLLLRTRDGRRRVRRQPGGRVRHAAVWTLAVLALTGAALGTVQGRHGQLMVDRQTTEEVAAARYLYDNAAPGATVALATANFPARLSADYGEFNQTLAVGEPELVEGARLRGTELGPAQLPAIEEYLDLFGGTTTYLVVSDGMARQSEFFGYFPDGALERLDDTLAADPGWSTFYRNQDVVIYEYGG